MVLEYDEVLAVLTQSKGFECKTEFGPAFLNEDFSQLSLSSKLSERDPCTSDHCKPFWLCDGVFFMVEPVYNVIPLSQYCIGWSSMSNL